ncbi:hypothetical protein ACIQOV_15270 [Kitasatospora sp. NPDC091257]|uniref:hypothetical protein n=1 Tax=Kitasatospora sp. NPDC091257 TaxID=3364084 RepID=UPI0037FB7D6D
MNAALEVLFRTVADLLEQVKETAVAQWGTRLSQEKLSRWVAARDAGVDPVSRWADMIEFRHHELPAERAV